ncbi:MAG TPA: type I-U CRISPR-associated protein Cas8c [Gammaproteobacteria bacterium]|nr:type I-U CRISPR-associated protein Cas8c [Gammaproteobacteria bacterium]
MAQASIPVDLFNPGQVFACLGFLEAVDQLLGGARGGFGWSSPEGERFYLSANGDANPVQAVLECLASARVFSVIPDGVELSTEKWNVAIRTLGADEPFPMRLPESPEKLPALIECDSRSESVVSLLVDYWGDSTSATGRDNVKFWAGSGGLPGAARLSGALDLVREVLTSSGADPFSVSSPQSNSFRFDWRRDYIPIDAGFSPNDHKGAISMVGFPIVEIMAAIGLSNARPKSSIGTKFEYRYSVIEIDDSDHVFEPLFLRAALGGADCGFPKRDFVMLLAKPGKQSKDRCITKVIEETRE